MTKSSVQLSLLGDVSAGDVVISQKRPRVAKPPAPGRKPMKIPPGLVARLKGATKPSFDHALAFRPAVPMPGVVPKDQKLAMDEACARTVSWANTSLANVVFNQGYSFLGYPYLSELAQVAEYRLISEVISTEATRKWIKIKSAADEDAKKANKDAAAKKAKKIEELEDEFERLGVRKAFEAVSLQDGLFGRAHLYIDTGATDERDELQTPLGDGGKITKSKLKKGTLRALKTVEPVWTYPMAYNAQDPLKDGWYDPQIWYVMSKGIHVSRLLTFVAKPVPDLLKPSFSFGGLSLTQMAKPYVDNWLETRQSVNDIIQAFSVMVLQTDMAALLQDGAGNGLLERADLFNGLRNDRGLMMLDKNTEDFKNVSAPLSSLDKLQAQAQEHICSVSRIPLVKYTGLSPSGLNASSDGEIRAFYDTIHAYQENFFGPHLRTIFKMCQINIWGDVDEDLSFEFEPLWELDEKTVADMQKVKADTHGVYIDKGVIDPAEVRQSLADDPGSPYTNLDVDDVPEPIIEPENVHETETDDVGGGAKKDGPAAPKTEV